MKPIATTLAALAGLGLAACVSAPKQDLTALSPGAYEVEPAHASLTFKVQHFGLSWYTMRFDQMDVALDFDPAAPERSSVEAIVDPTSISVYHPEKQDDWEQELANDDKFLMAGTYPQIIFKSTKIEVTGDNAGVVTGDLTLRGVTKPISMDVVFNGANSFPWAPGEKLLGFSASGAFNRSDFGMDALLPNIVSDETRFEIEIEFKPAS